ncbi:MAG TPA: fumarylacetoacetate hydrolase family protein [Beijerinckiaceae bacterium]|nr:fumarylacetoacetate hydrolase family protein [Beijerinckiaceae bacterium]
MRFLSFSVDGMPSYGIATSKGVHDLGLRHGNVFPDLRSFLEAQSTGLLAPLSVPRETDYKLSEIEYDPVIPNPGKIICVGANYVAHREEMGRPEIGHPTLFTRYADTLVGHKAGLVKPNATDRFDYEGELAVIIGQHCRNVPDSEAMDVIAGVCCFNDGSVRDWQRHSSQFTAGKNFPGTGALGPEMVTLDELGDLGRLKLETRLNGQTVQSTSLDMMIFSITASIAYITAFTPLAPGDIIATGTPGGVGDKRNPPLYMKVGDKVEVVIEKVGHLTNPVVAEDEA